MLSHREPFFFKHLLLVFTLSVALSTSFSGCRRVTRPHDRAQLHNNQGVVYLNRKEYDKAYQEFRIAVELSPEYADAYQNLGVYHEQTGDLTRAEEAYLRAIKADFKYAPPHAGLCSVYVRRAQYDKAIEQGKKALKKDEMLADAAYCVGLAAFRKKDFPEAASWLRRATDIDPNTFLAHNELGKVYIQQGKLDEAIYRFRIATEVLPSFEEGWRNYAYALYQKGDLLKAAKAAKAALGINERSTDSHKLYAAILIKQASTEPLQALAYCQQAVGELRTTLKLLDAFDAEALGNLGIAERCVGAEKRRQGDLADGSTWLQQAEKTFQRAIEINPDRCTSYLLLAELYSEDLREKDRAIGVLEEALRCSKKDPKPLSYALFKLGSLYVENKKVQKGIEYLCQYVKIATPAELEFQRKAQSVIQANGGCR